MMEERVVKSEVSGLSFKETIFKYLRFFPLFIIFIAISLLGAYIYLRYATEIYTATGQILIRDEKGDKTPGSTVFLRLRSR